VYLVAGGKTRNNGKVVWPFILLAFIFLVWFVRYPLWSMLSNLELIFLMLIGSYLVILVFSLFLLKKDSKKSLTKVFKVRGRTMPLFSVGFALLFQLVWFLLFMLFGGKLILSSPSGLSPYSEYVPYSVELAFGLYLAFALFGAFSEEVTFRCYVQSRFAQSFGNTLGVAAGAVFFALQHIQFFVYSWIVQFFQNQFVYVLCGGIFIGLFFIRTGEDVWSVFAFHGTGNLCNILLPIASSAASPFSSPAASITAFAILIILLQLFTKRNYKKIIS
jgi:membrane protease YdiL (CAAX protease family)